MKKYKQITAQERDQITIDLAAIFRKLKSAAKLDRSVSNISSEVKRNRVLRSTNPLKNSRVYICGRIASYEKKKIWL